MKYTGPIFRPPPEANTLLLQVTVGCTHNKCTFCTMYREVKFSIESLEQIEKDLLEARAVYGSVKRIFLLNADAFVLSASILKQISAKIIELFPEMEVITMYASIRNIMDKTEEELVELKDSRINDLWIGLESGSDDVLKYMNKGFTVDDSYIQLERLEKAGIRHNAIILLGAGGKGKAIESAISTAKLISTGKPNLVGFTSLGFFPGSELTTEMEQKRFIPASEREIIEEEIKFVELVDVDGMLFYGDHPLNAVSLNGVLPRDKEYIISSLEESLLQGDEEFLDSVVVRSAL